MAPNSKKNTKKDSGMANKESGKTGAFQKVCAEGEAELMELAKEMSTDLGHLIGHKSGAETTKEFLGLSEEECKLVFGDMEAVDGKIEVLKQKLAELVASAAVLKMLDSRSSISTSAARVEKAAVVEAMVEEWVVAWPSNVTIADSHSISALTLFS